MKLDDGAATAEPEVQLPSATKTPAPRLIARSAKTKGEPSVRVTGAGLDAIERLARNGANDNEIARQIGINRETLRIVRQRDPAVDEAMARGRARLDMEFVDRFVEWSRAGLWQPAMFFAKCRLGWKENGDPPPGMQIARADTVQIVIPAAMSPEDFRALIAPPQKAEVIDVEPVR